MITAQIYFKTHRFGASRSACCSEAQLKGSVANPHLPPSVWSQNMRHAERRNPQLLATGVGSRLHLEIPRVRLEMSTTLTLFAELLDDLGLSELQGPISLGPHAPLTLSKAVGWLEAGVLLATLEKAGVTELRHRQSVADGLLAAREANRLAPDPLESGDHDLAGIDEVPTPWYTKEAVEARRKLKENPLVLGAINEAWEHAVAIQEHARASREGKKPPLLTTFAALLAELGLSELEGPISLGPHAPLTLSKAKGWLDKAGGIAIVAALHKAGVTELRHRRAIVDAMLEARKVKRLAPLPLELAPFPPPDPSPEAVARRAEAEEELLKLMAKTRENLLGKPLRRPPNLEYPHIWPKMGDPGSPAWHCGEASRSLASAIRRKKGLEERLGRGARGGHCLLARRSRRPVC